MLYKKRKAMIHSSDGDSEFFNLGMVTGVREGKL